MLLFVSGATATVRRYATCGGLGHLLVPRNRNRVETLLATGLPLAADNGCYGRWDRRAFLRMLRALAPHGRTVSWVVAPDVVADAPATLARFALWQPVLAYLGLPIAFVAQDGQEQLPVPWAHIRCLFVGGSTCWKEGVHAAALIGQAKRRGLWVHVGRVSTLRRERLMAWAGADSIDGSHYSRFPDTYIPAALERLRWLQHGIQEVFDATTNDDYCAP